MVKTTTKTNFTKNVKYKVGTIKSVTDLMANQAICEGDDAPLDFLYDAAVFQLEKFTAKNDSGNGIVKKGMDAFIAEVAKMGLPQSMKCSDSDEGTTEEKEDSVND